MGNPLGDQDPAVFEVILAEQERQEDGLELIASENYTSVAVMEAVGSVLTNKYAEGLPRKRYYGGCIHVDKIEEIARDRAKEAFGCDMVNVQPHSGASANAAVFLALLKAGDTFLGQDLSHGGHLTHGSPVNASGLLYHATHYGVNEVTGRIDMDQVRERALAERPKLIVCGASAYARTLDFAAFRAIADEVGAVLMADIAHIAGLVVGGEHPSPVPYCDVVTTTTHKTLRGPRGGMIMAREQYGAAINKAVFPGSQGGPLMHVIAGKAVCFGEALRPSFKAYARQVRLNATAMAHRLMEHGIKLVSDGTDNHLMLIDLARSHGLDEITGKKAEGLLELAGITTNKNTVPGEKRSPFVTSGIRIGTPAITTRGLVESDCVQIADWMVAALRSNDDVELLSGIRAQVAELCRRFPVYPTLHSQVVVHSDEGHVTPQGETIPSSWDGGWGRNS